MESQNDDFTSVLGEKYQLQLGSMQPDEPATSWFPFHLFGIKLRPALSLVLLPAGPADKNDKQGQDRVGTTSVSYQTSNVKQELQV